MLPQYQSPQDVIRGIQSIDTSTFTNEEVRDKFIDIRSLPVQIEMMVKTGEFFFAKREDIPSEALIIGAGVLAFCTANGFWGLGTNNRGMLMLQAMLQEAGVPHPTAAIGGTYPAPEDLPEPLPEFSGSGSLSATPPLPPAAPTPTPAPAPTPTPAPSDPE